jgi:hypothetical protein
VCNVVVTWQGVHADHGNRRKDAPGPGTCELAIRVRALARKKGHGVRQHWDQFGLEALTSRVRALARDCGRAHATGLMLVRARSGRG